MNHATLSTLRPTPAMLRHGLRTALAAAITAVLTQLLHLQQGYWAVFSAVIVMQADFGSSIAAGWARLVGTAAGALCGAACVAAADALLAGGSAVLGAAILVSSFFCAVLAAKNKNFRLAGLTSAVVICLHVKGEGLAFALAVYRFLEVGLGIVAALAVSMAWPSRARVLLRHGLSAACERLARLADDLAAVRADGGYDRPRLFHAKDALLRLGLRNRELLAAARREPGSSARVEDLAVLLRAQDRLAEHLRAMDHALEPVPDAPPPRVANPEAHMPDVLAELCAALAALLRALAATLSDAPPLDAAPSAGACAAHQDAALRAAGARFAERRRRRAFSGCDADEVIRVYAFYHALRESAREARFMAESLGVAGAGARAAPTGGSPSGEPSGGAPLMRPSAVEGPTVAGPTVEATGREA